MAGFTTSDGVRIVYDDIGPRDGVPVVLCHGLAAAAEQLAADAQWLAGQGFRVIAPDLRGHGRSGKPATMVPASFSIARMTADLVELLQHAGTAPVHWVGNSLGGILALEMLRDNEARLRTLATFGTAYRLHLPGWFGAAVPWSYRLLGVAFTARLTAVATTRNGEARRLIESLLQHFDPEVGGLVAANLVRYDLRPVAQRARLPILLMRGSADRTVNSALGPTLAAMTGRPNFTLVEIAGGGHCANLDATDAWRAALLAFWDGR